MVESREYLRTNEFYELFRQIVLNCRRINHLRRNWQYELFTNYFGRQHEPAS